MCVACHYSCEKLRTRAIFLSLLKITLIRAVRSEKKADVLEQSELFEHVGLLVNWLPGRRGALYLVIRRFQPQTKRELMRKFTTLFFIV